MKVVTKESFRLPYLGREKYIELVRSGVTYDKKTGAFSIKNADNIDRIRLILSEILNDDIAFAQKCFICQTRFTCTDCGFSNICGTRDIPLYCICKPCYSKPDFAERYFTRLKSSRLR